MKMGKEAGSSSQKNNDEALQDRLKVLCLHGYRQNADSFRSKLGSFRKFVNKYAEFTFVTAPHIAPSLPGEEDKEESPDQKSWWFNKDDGTFKGTNKDGPAIGFGDSVKIVEKAWSEQGPFDGILGFSQGACFAGLLCSLSMKNFTTIKPRFAILSSGFRSGSLVHKNFYEDKISMPSLHIYGENDDIIPSEMSEALASTFENSEIITHPGGHYFAATAKQKNSYINFFQDRLQDILEERELKNAVEINNVDVDSDEND